MAVPAHRIVCVPAVTRLVAAVPAVWSCWSHNALETQLVALCMSENLKERKMCPQCLGSECASGEEQSWKHSLACPSHLDSPVQHRVLYFSFPAIVSPQCCCCCQYSVLGCLNIALMTKWPFQCIQSPSSGACQLCSLEQHLIQLQSGLCLSRDLNLIFLPCTGALPRKRMAHSVLACT